MELKVKEVEKNLRDFWKKEDEIKELVKKYVEKVGRGIFEKETRITKFINSLEGLKLNDWNYRTGFIDYLNKTVVEYTFSVTDGENYFEFMIKDYGDVLVVA